MSDSQGYEEVTVSDHGITVTKRFEEDEFPVPAIAFEFSSEREEGVLVRIRDSVPEGVAVEDLGFHPEYGSEHWTVEEDTISFQRQLEAESEYTTVYGIRATGTDDVEQFLTRPEIEEVDPPISGESETSESDSDTESGDDIIPDIISGDSEPASDLEDDLDAEAEDEEDVETLELKDPNEEASVDPDTAQSSAETTEQSESTTVDESGPGTAESLVSALAAEIRENDVEAEDVELLREALDLADEESGSMQARVERVQSDIADLRAYTDALEEFLDDNGTAEQLIDDFRSDVSSLESTVENMEATLEDNSEELSAVSDEVGSLGEDVSELDREVSEVSNDVDDVESTVGQFEESIDELRSSVDQLEDQVTDGDVAERVDDLEADLADLKDWQERIQQTFGS